MQQDIRQTELYREIALLFAEARKPGTGQISDAADVHVSPDGTRAVFSGTIMDKLEGAPSTRICSIDLTTGDTRVLTLGPNVDRLPKFCPQGRQVAFLSDRHQAGDFQLYLLDPDRGAARRTAPVRGWVEYLHWSPDGKRILLGVAGHGADISGGQGALTTKSAPAGLPSWMPSVESKEGSHRWRRAWVYEVATDRVHEVACADKNIWEAVWCGNEFIAAVTSNGPNEGLWYSARLHVIDMFTGASREIYAPRDQLGWPAVSASAKYLAIVEGLSSDRGFVAGDLRLIDVASGAMRTVDTHRVDITHTEWRSDRYLLLCGHRGLETVVGLCDVIAGVFTELWASRDLTASGRYATASGFGEQGDCVLIGESFLRAPEVATIRGGEYQTIKSFGTDYAERARVIDAVESLHWRAPDGIEIEGWLLRPRGAGPYPLVMNVHGGPVWHWRPAWLGRWGAAVLTLLKRGYAIFLPNPRGSSGRGQEFARGVLGDVGGADAQDCLSGIDHLVARGVVDPARIGVTGGSYGGFMASWLITQDTRFAAAVPVAPHTNHVTAQLLSNIPQFVALFVGDGLLKSDGMYFLRSPVLHAHRTRTPTLNICGALDRSAPPEEAAQFHNALLENGVESVLVSYPAEGHGVRSFPAAIDYAARVVSWFEQHLAQSGLYRNPVGAGGGKT